MAWQQLTLHIDAADLAQTEALLKLAGAEAIAISDDGDAPILEPAPGTTPLWPTLTLRALFPAGLDLGGIAGVLGPRAASGARLELIDDRDIERASRQTVRAMRIGPRLTIVPAEEFQSGNGEHLGLHMGLAFGTGRHPTTRLCLGWLEREFAGGGTVLDYGCGTAVLALAALRLGAAAATAIDNDPQALVASRRNAELNGLSERLTIGSPAELGRHRFDLILANILAQPLIDLAAGFAQRQAAGGRIVLSGLLVTQLDMLEARYADWYERFARAELAGWGLLTAVRRNEYDR